jgi:hypothetical protein
MFGYSHARRSFITLLSRALAFASSERWRARKSVTTPHGASPLVRVTLEAIRQRTFANDIELWPRKRVVATLLAVASTIVFGGLLGRAATVDQNPLQYARGFLITGDYVVGGVDLTPALNPPVNGLSTGTIPMTGVPANTDIVAAFLYWEAIYAPGAQPTAGTKFRGVPLDAAVGWPTSGVPGLKGTTWGSPLPGNNTSNCWGAANGAGSQLTMFRADVLHLMPKVFDARGNWTGQYLVNDTDLANNVDLDGHVYAPHTVTLPESNGNHAVQSAGATLVVIYRNRTPSNPNEQLTRVALYDGVYVQAQGNAMGQTLQSFYKHTGANGKITPIVGSGAGNTKTRLFFNGVPVALNPFPMTSPSSDRSWNFPTYSVTMGDLSSPPTTVNGPGFYDGYGETATTGIDHTNTSPYECLALAGLVFSTQVLDNDKDGLPDALEGSSNAGLKPWRNPDVDLSVTDPGRLLPDLHAMGASTNQQDIVVELGAMQTTSPQTTYGSASAPYDSSATPILNSVPLPAHSHLPGPDALRMLGDVYFNHGVVPHFDVGNTAAYLNASYPGNAGCSSGAPWTPDPVCQYLVPSAAARGGEMITESKCVPQDPNNPYATCRFYDYPGTVGWKFGFEAFRDAPVTDSGQELTTAAQLQAWTAGTTPNYMLHRRRFDPPRRQFVHYLLYAHAQGKRKSLPCIVNGNPADYDVGGASCTTNNPFFQPLDYNVPSSSSGVSDLPGNGALITLGLWDKVSGTGTTFAQASTTLHELGHNLELSHGGKPPIFGSKAAGTVTYFEPNCKPNYFSSMSYLFQAHGLIDVFGNQHLDYSSTAENNIDENALSDTPYGPTPIYQPTWFAPATSSLATLLGASQATRLCNGVKVSELSNPPAVAMARVWAPVPSLAFDWNVAVDWLGDDPANPTGSGIISNSNFDGVFNGGQTLSDVLYGWNDWANIRLNQLGASRGIGRSVVGPEFEASSGDVAADCPGCGDVAADCPGCGDVAADCPGCGDVAADCPGCGDVAADCPGCGDVAADCPGCGDVAADCPDCGAPRDLDFTTAKKMGRTPPPSFTSCILGADSSTQQGCTGPWIDNNGIPHQTQPAAGDPMFHRVYATWKIPSVDNVKNYLVYRQRGSTVPLNWQSTAVRVGAPATTSLVDTEELPDGLSFTYFVLAAYDDGQSGVSNFILIAKAIDNAPTANADSYATGKGVKLTVLAAQGVLSNDTDADSPHFKDFTTNPTPNGRGVAVLVSPPSNAAKNGFTLNPDGSFTYNPKGGFVGTDSFTYVTSDGKWSRDNTVSLSGNSAVKTVTITVQ